MKFNTVWARTSSLVKGAVAVGTLIVTAGCTSDLSRREAEQLIRAQLEQTNVVQAIRVYGVARHQFLESGHLLLSSEERWCSVSECRDIMLANGPGKLFSSAKGRYLKRLPYDSDGVVLTLSKPLSPQNLKITGIVSDNQQRVAAVEFTFSYEPPATIAGLNVTAQTQGFMIMVPASGVKISNKSAGEDELLGLHQERWTFQRYDDGWRITR